jgi:hypothetical protein
MKKNKNSEITPIKQKEDRMQTEQTKPAGNLVFKSSRSNIEGLKFVSGGDLKAGAVAATGIYSEAVANPRTKKTDYKILELDENGEETGETTIINAGGNLGYRMKDISVGEIIQIVYLGKSPMSKGAFKGTLAHNWDVLTAVSSDESNS